MGLDMYLTKSYYVKNWDYMTPEERHTITILKGGQPTGIPVEKITFIETECMYWRKANEIHNWFVQNVQDGVDQCQRSYVSREQLEELLATVNQVLVDRKAAPHLLPTVEGCFFGDTKYDKYYWKNLKETAEALKKELATNDSGEYYYQASW